MVSFLFLMDQVVYHIAIVNTNDSLFFFVRCCVVICLDIEFGVPPHFASPCACGYTITFIPKIFDFRAVIGFENLQPLMFCLV